MADISDMNIAEKKDMVESLEMTNIKKISQNFARLQINMLSALSLQKIDDLLAILQTNAELIGYRIDSKTKSLNEKIPYPRAHFNIDGNSRRFVHCGLFWMILLGPKYPMNDFLINNTFWKYIRNKCGYGVTDSRGHSKFGNKICYNPNHYIYPDITVIDKMIRNNLQLVSIAVVNNINWVTNNEIVKFIQYIKEHQSEMTTY
jgi:hypothetical protein